MRPIGLHECRHTYASFMIAAGVNAKQLSTYMGHSSVMITFDRYGHLMPGNEAEAARLLDSFLAARAGHLDMPLRPHLRVIASYVAPQLYARITRSARPRRRRRGPFSSPARHAPLVPPASERALHPPAIARLTLASPPVLSSPPLSFSISVVVVRLLVFFFFCYYIE
jgi:hypothetical protein